MRSIVTEPPRCGTAAADACLVGAASAAVLTSAAAPTAARNRKPLRTGTGVSFDLEQRGKLLYTTHSQAESSRRNDSTDPRAHHRPRPTEGAQAPFPGGGRL